MQIKSIVVADEYRVLLGLWGCSLFYAGLSNLIFLAGYLRGPYNVIGVLLLLAAVALLYCRLRHLSLPNARTFEISSRYVLMAGLAVLVWCAFSGVGGLGFSFGDPICGDMMMRDLIFKSWPVIYTDSAEMTVPLLQPGEKFYLVYYIGFYLPAALFGKLFGSFTAACIFEAFWGTFGVMLSVGWFFYFLAGTRRWNAWRILAVLLVFFFFKTNSFLFDRLYHSFYALFYWGNAVTLYYNAPQHTVNAWLAAAVTLAALQKKLDLSAASAFLAMCIIITPFALVGSVFLWCGAVYVNWKTVMHTWKYQLLVHGMLFMALVVPAALYITGSAFSFPILSVFKNPAFRWPLWGYGLGVLLLIPLFLVWREFKKEKETPLILLIIFSSLLFSTLINVGFCNDFPIRASTGPLFLLWIFVACAFLDSTWRDVRKWMIAGLVMVSILTQGRMLWMHRDSLGFPPSSGNASFISFPQPSRNFLKI